MGSCISVEFRSARTTHLEATNRVINESIHEYRVQELLAENKLLRNKNKQLRNENKDITTEMQLLEMERDKILADQIKISVVEENKLKKDLKLQVCVVGKVLKRNKKLIQTLKYFQIPIVYRSNSLEPIEQEDDFVTIFILDDFEGETFTRLHKAGKRILGPTAILQQYNTDILRKEPPTLLNRIRPTYTTSMKDVVVTFSGFRSNDELKDMIDLVHHMGGKVRREFSFTKTTHLVATSNAVHGEKYKFAATTDIPIMTVEWVKQAWARRRDVNCYATSQEMMTFKMLPFAGSVLAFVGYEKEEEVYMTDICFVNGGKITDPGNPQCTHIIVEDGLRVNSSGFKKSVWILDSTWFWECVQMEVKVDENSYKFQYELLPSVWRQKEEQQQSLGKELTIPITCDC